MKTVCIIQARMASARLPGKVMLPLAGEPMLYRMVERLKRSAEIDRILLAVPRVEGGMGAVVARLGISTFFSDNAEEDDCLARTYWAAATAGADIVVRIPGDNPCIEPAEVDKIIQHHRMFDHLSFCSNIQEVFGNGYPDGIGAEVFHFELLERAWRNNHNPAQREHVHLNFFNYETQRPVDGTPVSTVICPKEFAFPQLKLDVNTQRDYVFMKRLYDELYPRNPNFHVTDILAWLKERQRQSSLLERSLYSRGGSVH